MIPCHSLRNKSKVVGFKDKEEEDSHRISFREIAVFTEGSSGDPLDQSARRCFDQFPPKRNLELRTSTSNLIGSSPSPLPPSPSPLLASCDSPPILYLKSIGGSDFAMLARSLLRVPNRAIARQSLGKSTVRLVFQSPIESGRIGQSTCRTLPRLCPSHNENFR